MPLEIITLPCLSDNYVYLIRDEATGKVAVVDAPEAAPILRELEARKWPLDLILITHHHADHIDGVDALRAATGAKVTGAEADSHRLPALDSAVVEGDHVAFGAANGRVIEVPGHTIGNIAFHFPTDEVLFTADSLMALGCGRLFEGTALQMWDSLSKLAVLPPETRVCSGHEYTESNARFALTIEPQNSALISRVQRVRAARANGQPTVPSSLADELATNPFLRAGRPEVKASLGLPDASDAEVFAEIRRRKDRF
jgi:hydroxyacylglutathione hydrolase